MSQETAYKLKAVEQDPLTANSRVRDIVEVNFYGKAEGCKIFTVKVDFLSTLKYGSPDFSASTGEIEQAVKKVTSWIDGTDLRIGDSKHIRTYAKIGLHDFISDGEVARRVSFNGETHGIIVGTLEAVETSTVRFLGNQDLCSNEAACDSTVEENAYSGGFPRETIHCERAVGHKGDHYVFTQKMNYKWGDKGGHGLSGDWRAPFGIPYNCESCDIASVVSQLEPAGEYSLLCKDCRYWLEPDAYRIVIDSQQYSVSTNFAGFGGQNFHIEFFDTKRKSVTVTLSHRGTVPTHLRDEIPDNARFINANHVGE